MGLLLIVEIIPAGIQEVPGGQDFEMYHVFNAEPLGIVSGSTVSRQTIEKAGLHEFIPKEVG